MTAVLLPTSTALPLHDAGSARLTAGARPDGSPVSLSDHVALHGGLPSQSRATTRDLLEKAAIAGRGGAGFPLLRKVESLGQGRAVVVVNGSEGEPAIWKDRVLLSQFPHLVLDGAMAAAELVRAHVVHVAVAEGSTAAIASLRWAIADRAAVRHDRVPVRLTLVQDRFVAGEASAVVARIDRGSSLPTFTTVRTSQQGVGRRPTLLCNAETFAQLGFLVHHGAEVFTSVGAPRSPGTTLFTVRGSVRRPSVVELPLGTTLGEVIGAAGGASEPLSAVLTGGYHGRWVSALDSWGEPMTLDGLDAAGGSLGAGLVLALPAGVCPLGESARVVRYLAEETAGQCGPCVNGLPAIAGAVESLARGGVPEAVLQDLGRWCGLVAGRGVCRHPDGTATFVRSVLTTFIDDVAAHLHGHCGRPVLGVLPV